jgi:hypothetical protein
MKRAANIRVRPGGMERLREIAAQFGALSRSGINAGEASVSELLDRVISGELVIVRGERTMEQDYSGYQINVTEFDGNLMAGDCTGLDMDAMPQRYCELLRERIEAAYPGAVVDITLERGTEGACPETRVYTPEGDIDEDIALAIGGMEERLFSSDAWYVESDTTDDAVILGPTGLETGPAWAALEAEGEANLQRAMEESRAHDRGEN